MGNRTVGLTMPAQTASEATVATVGDVSQARPTSAERTSRYRQRRASGLRSVDLDVRDREVEWLVHHNYLARHRADDADAIGRALGRLLDRLMSG